MNENNEAAVHTSLLSKLQAENKALKKINNKLQKLLEDVCTRIGDDFSWEFEVLKEKEDD